MSSSPAVVRFVSIAEEAWGAEESLLTLVRHRPSGAPSVELAAMGETLRERWFVDTGVPARVIAPARSRVGRLLRALPHIASAQPQTAIVLWDVDLAPLAFLLSPWLRARGVRVFLDLHVTLAGTRGRTMLRVFGRALAGCMSISRYTAAQFGNPGSPRVHVVQRPIETATDSRCDTPADVERYTVGIIGRVDPEKGVIEAVRACDGVDTVTRVVVRGAPFVGDDGYLDEVQRVGSGLTTAEFVYEGRVPPGTALRGVDVLLHWNRHEPAGRVVQEAQLAGRVAVVPNEGGAPEFVEHGVTGLVYRAGSADDARRQLASLTAQARAEIGRQARDVARERYSPGARSAEYFAGLSATRT